MALTTGLTGCASRLCGVENRNIETFVGGRRAMRKHDRKSEGLW
jgi:hypothetical protein